ncbi:hypothetical protein GCM10017044_00300 [Kordiimonas sediminis]|uniref:Flp family type IVb pilin n=1 Tax=Kordiimonas sediminis TaxID=1735581 RepID=A0A919AKN4_9PROT|nr:Flp family type IVb pilin [Kordiimonas sediminis]GHF10557.1 hypothetical protein GCM10017044_00300 [Kordiimonas sediminis]
MLNFLKSLKTSEEGATAIEYGLIVALIAVLLILSLTSIGENIASTFNDVSSGIENANPDG